MNKSPLPVIDSYPRLAADPSVSARYCALVSRDPEAPRSRRALHGRGRQFLELRSQVCATVSHRPTSTQIDAMIAEQTTV